MAVPSIHIQLPATTPTAVDASPSWVMITCASVTVHSVREVPGWRRARAAAAQMKDY